MRLPFFLARRLSLSSEGHKSSPSVRVATVAVALSVAVMIAAIAIVLGFKKEITDRVTGFNPHITISTHPEVYPDDPLVSLSPSLKKILDETPFISGISLTGAIPGILKTPDDFKGIYLKSASGDDIRRFLSSQLEEGVMPDFSKLSDSIVISRRAADQLGLRAGNKVDTYVLTNSVRVRRLTVAGVYNSHFDTYDDIYTFVPLPLVQDLGNVRADQGTQIAVSVDDFRRVEEYAAWLRKRLADAYDKGEVYRFYAIDTARQSGANYFSWLSLLDMNVIVVLTLMTAVACVTLVSGMLTVIVDKQRFISIMKAMGASDHMLRTTFVWLALRVAATGMIAGDLLMTALLYLQKETHLIPLDPESYYIDFVPVEISWTAIALLNAGVAVVAWLVLVLPARFVATVR